MPEGKYRPQIAWTIPLDPPGTVANSSYGPEDLRDAVVKPTKAFV